MEEIRIALADDHTLVRKGIIAMLETDDDFKIVADAENGKELIEKLATLKKPADVCLLDVSMPEMNGYDTLVALKALYPAMRFLILTQLEHKQIIVRMLREGAAGYMLKTTQPGELKDAIRAILKNPYYHNKLINGQLFSMVQKGDEPKKHELTKREEEFLKLCCSELAYSKIAVKMGIAERTVAFYRESVFSKLGVNNRTALALYALKLGLVPVEELK